MIVRSGLNPKYDDPMTYCGQCPISVETLPEGFVIEDNLFFYNRRIQCGSSFDDLLREEFDRQAPPLLNELIVSDDLPAVLNFWHYNARLAAAGMTELVSVSAMLPALGVETPPPLLGWV